MRKFIAGATRIFLSVARSRVEARSPAKAMRHLGKNIRRRGSDDKKVGVAGKFDMAHG